jgi:hypothetical protein
MLIDKSYSGFRWKDVYNEIFNSQKRPLSPILIIRDDDPSDEIQLIDAFLEKSNCLYLRLGAILNTLNLDESILNHLDYTAKRQSHSANFRKIAKIYTDRRVEEKTEIIIIDNCHKIVSTNALLIFGLTLELHGIVQFVFLLPRYYKSKIITGEGVFLNKLFFGFIKKVYDITK